VELCDVATGKAAERLRFGPAGGTLMPFFTPDGRHLVTLNGNGTVYVLRLATIHSRGERGRDSARCAPPLALTRPRSPGVTARRRPTGNKWC
jgi:hypothetical protein